MDFMLDRKRRLIIVGASIIGLLLAVMGVVCVALYVVGGSSESDSKRCQLWDSEPASREPGKLNILASEDARTVASFYGHIEMVRRSQPGAISIERKYLPMSLRQVRSFRTPDLNYRLLLDVKCGAQIELQLYKSLADSRLEATYGLVFLDGREFCYFRPSRIDFRATKRHYRCDKEDLYNCHLFAGANESEQLWSRANIVLHQFEFEIEADPKWVGQNGTFSTPAHDCS